MITFSDLKSGRVKLVFGNLEQIEAIKAYQKKIEERETNCHVCDGAGEITCPSCNGSGKFKK